MFDVILANYHDIILHSARIFSSVFEIVLSYLMVNFFFKARPKVKRFDYLPFFLLAAAAILLQEYAGLGNSRYLAECAVLTVILFTLYTGRVKDKIIGSVIFTAIILFAVGISELLFILLRDKTGLVPDVNSPFARLLKLTLCNMIMIPVAVLISSMLKTNAGGIRTLRTWMGLLLVPVVTLLTIAVFQYIVETYSPGAHISAYIYVASIGSILVNVLVFILFWVNQHQASIKRENDILQAQLSLQETSVKNLENAYNRTRHFRHDIKNHMLTMNILAENGELEEIKKYLKEMNGIIDESSYIRITGISAVDAILNEKLYEAQSESITTNFDVMNMEKNSIKPVDMCIILSNALDNAIEANNKISDPEKRYIRLKMHGTDSFTVISISNPAEAAYVTPSGGGFSTSKKDTENHGFGLKSIKNTAAKYDGEMLTKFEDGVFSLIIRLNALSE